MTRECERFNVPPQNTANESETTNNWDTLYVKLDSQQYTHQGGTTT